MATGSGDWANCSGRRPNLACTSQEEWPDLRAPQWKDDGSGAEKFKVRKKLNLRLIFILIFLKYGNFSTNFLGDIWQNDINTHLDSAQTNFERRIFEIF